MGKAYLFPGQMSRGKFNTVETSWNKSRSSHVSSGRVFFVIGLVGVIVFGLFSIGQYVSPVRTFENCVVTDKDRTSNSGGLSSMRIYTDNCGVLLVKDNWFEGVTNSADIYGSITVGETYTFETTGYRVGLFSWFPIINKSTEVVIER